MHASVHRNEEGEVPMEYYLGSIQIFGFNFAPVGWQMCGGQLLPISQYSALFSLLGTSYGGDGRTTFALPDLRGRMPLGFGNGPGLPPYAIGEMGGTTQVTLTAANMASHSHPANVTARVQVAGQGTDQTTTPSAQNSFLGQSPTGGGPAASIWSTELGSSPVDMGGVNATVQIGNAGGNMPFQIMNPFLALNFCIAMQGIFPSRS